VFQSVDRSLKVEILICDGRRAHAGDTIMKLSGRAASMLTAERTALNFMQRMTGIATLTGRFVEKTRRFGVKILDTRKTTPGLRKLEKYAVLCGGGHNHRMGLHDMALVKDNHRHLWRRGRKPDLCEAILSVRKLWPGTVVEVEVENFVELRSALKGSPDWIMLDNMPPKLMRKCAEACRGKCQVEASGGITLDNVEKVAATGVDAISVGALTHSAPAADLALELTLE
jgi:nicotinate-nucleotide pyrophosphorylase (carboxylating)